MTTIQVRNVSDETSRALKAKAALEGRSLSDYLLRELDGVATRLSRAELLERIASRGVTTLDPAAQMLPGQQGPVDDARRRRIGGRRDPVRNGGRATGATLIDGHELLAPQPVQRNVRC